MELYKVAENEKCGYCNYKNGELFLLGESEEDAKKQHNPKQGERGLCGTCMCIMLSRNTEHGIMSSDYDYLVVREP